LADRRPLVAGNWKMNGTRAAIEALVRGVAAGLERSGPTGARAGPLEVVLCPPFVYLADVAARLTGSRVALGAQNVAERESGAYTGEVAPAMLRDVGCSHAIVGHSERRALFGETDEVVSAKMLRAIDAGLTPIVCVGESLGDREAGRTESVVGAQVDAVLAARGAGALAQAVLAYEPVWAIGTGRTATPEQAQAVHAFVRERIAGHDRSVAGGIRILYGGSVQAGNAASLFAMSDIDGGLIGGASLDAEEFVKICAAAR